MFYLETVGCPVLWVFTVPISSWGRFCFISCSLCMVWKLWVHSSERPCPALGTGFSSEVPCQGAHACSSQARPGAPGSRRCAACLSCCHLPLFPLLPLLDQLHLPSPLLCCTSQSPTKSFSSDMSPNRGLSSPFCRCLLIRGLPHGVPASGI